MDTDGNRPEIAPHLVNEELRLPSSFRRLCESVTYTDEEIGRIVRCLALGTEVFLTPRIEPDVKHYSDILKKRAATRERVMKFRQAKGLAGKKPGKKAKATKATEAETEPVQPEPIEPVPMQPAKSVESLAKEVVEVKPVEPIKPINPIEPVEPVEVVEANPVEQQTFVGQLVANQPANQGKMEGQIVTDMLDLMGDPIIPKRQRKSADVVRSVDTRADSVWTEKFAIFWKQYPRKVAKADAFRAFVKIIKQQTDVDGFMATTLASIEWWKTQDNWIKDRGKYVPHPATWLNRGSWADARDNKDAQVPGRPEFLQGDAESDDDLLRRMQGG